IPLSGPILAAKAEKLAADLGNEIFTVKFKKRQNIASKSICGESRSVDSAVVDDYIASKLPALLKDCEPKNIYKADVTGLFDKLLPNKTLAIKRENCHSGKHSKECITVLANIEGSEKLKLLVISKSQKPRCFKNVKGLPVDYKANTRAFFIEWVKKFDRKIEYQKRRVLVFIHNCQATTMIFLPPNCTSKLQPTDQGIIKSFKQNYRCLLLQHIIACFELRENSEINLLQGIQFAHHAWRKVTMRY
uniref:DDE-1 domain-containing protein n=1 Tax=Latimeria chalumnae TaxID=7897 RepID=H3AKX6_LATCH